MGAETPRVASGGEWGQRLLGWHQGVDGGQRLLGWYQLHGLSVQYILTCHISNPGQPEGDVSHVETKAHTIAERHQYHQPKMQHYISIKILFCLSLAEQGSGLQDPEV